MALYAIGDTHLSLGGTKPMDPFGGAWTGYIEKLRAGFAALTADDAVVLCGDLSWGQWMGALWDLRITRAYLAIRPSNWQ